MILLLAAVLVLAQDPEKKEPPTSTLKMSLGGLS